MSIPLSTRSALLASTLAMALSLAACGSTTSTTSTSAGDPTGSKSPIKIALIASLSGAAGPTYAIAARGFDARIKAQNAEGGVKGHPIQEIVLDDQTSPTQVTTAVQQAISDGVVGIVADSPVFFLAAKYAQQAGIPVTGATADSTEWGTQPNTNMFPSDAGNTNPDVPYTNLLGTFFKSHGGTVVGTYGFGISPSSVHATYATAKASQAVGLKVGVMDTSVQFGTQSFATEALAAKSAGVNALSTQMTIDSGLALLTDLRQDGVDPKVVSFATGYDYTLIGSNVWDTAQGSYFSTEFRPWSAPNAGTQAMKAAFDRYEHYAPSQFPSFSEYQSWLGADLMILGLSKAGADPTPASTITALRATTAYNGNGIPAVTLNYKVNFGYNTKTECLWTLQAQKAGFHLLSAAPTCAPFIPGSTSLTAPAGL
jgi:branched-chain amino acid transport system substrate-binding protein